jgi:acetyltransferase-like isoleucine patch superfamily enzyme
VIAAGSVVSGVVPPRTLMRGNLAVPVERPVRRDAPLEVR